MWKLARWCSGSGGQSWECINQVRLESTQEQNLIAAEPRRLHYAKAEKLFYEFSTFSPRLTKPLITPKSLLFFLNAYCGKNSHLDKHRSSNYGVMLIDLKHSAVQHILCNTAATSLAVRCDRIPIRTRHPDLNLGHLRVRGWYANHYPKRAKVLGIDGQTH